MVHQVGCWTQIGHPGTFFHDLHELGVSVEVDGVVVIPPLMEGGVCSPSLSEVGVGCPSSYERGGTPLSGDGVIKGSLCLGVASTSTLGPVERPCQGR